MYYIEAQNNDQLNDSTQQKSQLTNTVKLQTLSNYKHNQITKSQTANIIKLRTNYKHCQITNTKTTRMPASVA